MFSTEPGRELVFETSALTQAVNQLAVEQELVDVEDEFTNVRRIGRLLERLRFQKAKRTAKRKRWKVTQDELTALAQAYGMVLDQDGTNGSNRT